MNLFNYAYIVFSVFFMTAFFYKTCTPDNKYKSGIVNALYRLSLIFWGFLKYFFSAIKWSLLGFKWTFNLLIQNTYNVIMVVILGYIIYFPLKAFGFWPEKFIINDDIIEFIVNVVTLLGFYALLETRKEQRKK